MFLCGVLGTSMGIALITTAGLGSTPVTSFSYALTFILPGTLGLYAFLVNILNLLGEIALQKRAFFPLQLLQLPVLALFTVLLDVWMALLSPLGAAPYAWRFALLLVGCCVLGLGVALQVLGDVLILPAEGFVKALAQRLRVEFGVVKTCYDVAMVASAIAVSLVCLGHIAGVREGTVLAALVTGAISRFFRVRLGWVVKKREAV